MDIIDVLENFRDIILFKARQLGWTWLLGAYAYHKVRFGESVKGLLSSQGEKEAKEFLDKPKFIHNHQPAWLKIPLLHGGSSERLDFQDNDSILVILPATSKAGRSTDATFVIRDEVASHPDAADNFAAIGPTIDAGGQSVDLSTIDLLDANSHFTERVMRAKSGARRRDLPSGLTFLYGGESGAVLVFGGWKLRPERGEGLMLDEWFEQQKRRYPPIILRQEYPETIEEALDIPSQSKYLDTQALEDMLYQVMPTARVDEVNTRNGVILMFKPSVVGERYCLFTDPSNGVEDPFHTSVGLVRTGEIVCEATGFVKADEVGKLHDELVRYYNNATNSYEINSYGGGIVGNVLNTLMTPNQAPRRKTDGAIDLDKMGQWTSDSHKKAGLEDLELAIRKRLIFSHRRETINQLQSLTRIAGEPLPVVPKGMHDDAIMSLRGLYQLLKNAPAGPVSVYSFKREG